jgi:peptidoglycan-N-acetylglucosamine deacetylase
MVQNFSDGAWDGDGLARLLADPIARGALVQHLKAFLDRNKFHGLTIDFEEVPPSAHANLKLFLQELRQVFAEPGYTTVLAVPMDDDDWPYEDYAKLVDYLLLMGYDEHWSEGQPGSIAGQGWFETALAKRMRTLDPARTIVSLGAYGYDWADGNPAEPVSFQEAMFSAWKSETGILFDPTTLNPHFAFVAADGKRHDVWFLDAVTAFNEIHAADSYEPAGYALWRLGSEDPSVWSVMAQPYGAPAPEEFRGRTFTTNQKGDIVNESYTKIPASLTIKQSG